MAEDKIALKKVYEAKPFYMAMVEFIVPFHDNQAMLTQLMTDIFATIMTNKYLVTLVDDGSKNSEFVNQIKNKKIPGVRILRNPKQMGFGAAVNLALKNPFPSQIPYVCVMHSDVRLRNTSWLDKLGSTLISMKDKGIKMVCPMTNNPEADTPRLVSDGMNDLPDFELRDSHIPMYCFLANRELFNKVGLLGEYPFSSVEALEYSDRMASHGYKQGVCGSSWVEHKGKGTMQGILRNRKAQEILRNATDEYNVARKKSVVENK